MPKRDGLTGLTTAQMVIRDQQAQAESFSTWWLFLLLIPLVLWILAQGHRSNGRKP